MAARTDVLFWTGAQIADWFTRREVSASRNDR
jgi:hypothetical protein